MRRPGLGIISSARMVLDAWSIRCDMRATSASKISPGNSANVTRALSCGLILSADDCGTSISTRSGVEAGDTEQEAALLASGRRGDFVAARSTCRATMCPVKGARTVWKPCTSSRRFTSASAAAMSASAVCSAARRLVAHLLRQEALGRELVGTLGVELRDVETRLDLLQGRACLVQLDARSRAPRW